MFLSDFDQTLITAKYVDNSSADSTFKTLIKSEMMPQWIEDETGRLYEHYGPIEKDFNMPYNEKFKHMNDWWSQDF